MACFPVGQAQSWLSKQNWSIIDTKLKMIGNTYWENGNRKYLQKDSCCQEKKAFEKAPIL